MSATASIECVKCERPFTEEDVKLLNYFVESGLCYECSKKLYKLSDEVSCFGKLHSSTARECRFICPDRKICPLFFTKEIFILRKEARQEKPKELEQKQIPGSESLFQPGSVIAKAFELCRKGISQRKFEQFVSRNKSNQTRLLRIFRKGTLYGKTWKWRAANGRFKIDY